MRLAFIADLHGNYTATMALAVALKNYNADKLYCLGDMVGKGPNSHKTMDWALENCDVVIGGNWDYGLGHKRYPADEFYFNQLGESRLATLRNLVPEHHIKINGVKIRLLHGRPVMECLLRGNAPNANFEELLNFNYTTSDQQDGVLIKKFDVVVYADTHRQLLRTVSGGHIINCGSVGNAIGIARACFSIMDIFEDSSYNITLCSILYDKKKAVEEAMQVDLPDKDIYINEILTGQYGRKGISSQPVSNQKIKLPPII